MNAIMWFSVGATLGVVAGVFIVALLRANVDADINEELSSLRGEVSRLRLREKVSNTHLK